MNRESNKHTRDEEAKGSSKVAKRLVKLKEIYKRGNSYIIRILLYCVRFENTKNIESLTSYSQKFSEGEDVVTQEWGSRLL